MLSDLGRNVRSLLWALVLGLSVWIAAVTDADPDEVRALPAPVTLELLAAWWPTEDLLSLCPDLSDATVGLRGNLVLLSDLGRSIAIVPPEIARAVAEPLSKTDRITLVSTAGEATGASRITGDVAKIVAELPPLIESLSGVDLRRLIEAIPALRKASGKPETK